MSGRPVSTASRLSRRLTQRISQRFSSGRRTRYGVPIAETREGLRFLAKSRHEIEAENAGTLYDIGDRNVAFVDPGAGFSSSHVPEGRRAQWNTFKIILVISILTVLIYGLTFLIGILLTWARTWSRADVNVVADTDILIFITLASFLCVFTAVIGLSGVLLNSRPILAIYTFLLWPALISILIVGYTAYKRANLRLDRKLNMAWSRYFDDLSRLRLQNNLHCCGYYSPLHQATFSRRCYPRTSLPGCKGKLYRYEMAALSITYKVTFSIVFVHLINIVCALLCSNHVNLTFGKGLTPRQYRLDMTHVRRNAFNIMKVLTDSAEQRGITLKPESSTQSFTRQLSVADIADGNRPSFEEVPLGRSTPTVPDIDYVATPPAYSHSLDASYDHLASGDPSPSPHHSIRMVGGQGEATGSLGSNVRGLGLSMSVSQNAAALLRERQLAQY
ncbi:hypothetical protein K437DRAFT_223871 [Tilletiaria anomala UBC 951]|uniref:Tetraspanin Tsp2 n=1 Tax=Tilletiaria anomala (strain ATCC 24038 / CBS 436.72 / UBC 951) TaxID=1037660 RepID=A0A066VW80_TILAU|nr:uncharacterized protein K437DRAFT_223871 [Tilletiaria anomala UBC 951]KDN45967.1 hypothetical protein K437DRAFT_223871 [Tilletiaria anomala UBC 951]